MYTEMSGLRVVVTGGAGFIGSHSVALLLKSGCEVMVVDDLRHRCPQPVPAAVRMVTEDVASSRAHQAILDFRPQALIHLAAQGGVSRSLRDPAGDAATNVVGTVAALASAAAAGCRRVVFASSGGAIYGRARRLPSREGDSAQPLSPYGAAKLAGEGYLGMFRRTFGLRPLALRYGNVYGPLQDGTGEAGMVAISCRRLVAGETPQVTGDGGQTRDFVYVGDVARANLLAVRSSYQGVLNLGTGVATSINEVALVLCRLAGHAAPPEHLEGRPGEVRSNYLEASRARRHLGWEPEVALDEGLRRTLASFHTSS